MPVLQLESCTRLKRLKLRARSLTSFSLCQPTRCEASNCGIDRYYYSSFSSASCTDVRHCVQAVFADAAHMTLQNASSSVQYYGKGNLVGSIICCQKRVERDKPTTARPSTLWYSISLLPGMHTMMAG